MFCQPQRIGDYFADSPGEPQAVYGKFGDPLRPFPIEGIFFRNISASAWDVYPKSSMKKMLIRWSQWRAMVTIQVWFGHPSASQALLPLWIWFP